MSIKLQAIDTAVQLPPYDKPVLALVEECGVCVVTRMTNRTAMPYANHTTTYDMWQTPLLDDVGVAEIIWWAEIPEIVPPK